MAKAEQLTGYLYRVDTYGNETFYVIAPDMETAMRLAKKEVYRIYSDDTDVDVDEDSMHIDCLVAAESILR